jgi:putative transposase
MPRKPREEEAGAIHHAYARGNGRQLIYRDDTDRRRYLQLLGETVVLMRWRCLGFCLMDNHFHLLIETPQPNLGRGMHRLQLGYVKWFNERHRRDGHLFQGRYGAVRVKSEAQLWATIAYIVHNPVEAGLCTSPREWRWSSHRYAFEGGNPDWLDVDRLLWHFSSVGEDPLRAYAALTASAQVPGTEGTGCYSGVT